MLFVFGITKFVGICASLLLVIAWTRLFTILIERKDSIAFSLADSLAGLFDNLLIIMLIIVAVLGGGWLGFIAVFFSKWGYNALKLHYDLMVKEDKTMFVRWSLLLVALMHIAFVIMTLMYLG